MEMLVYNLILGSRLVQIVGLPHLANCPQCIQTLFGPNSGQWQRAQKLLPERWLLE